MAKKYDIHHWDNPWIKTFLIVLICLTKNKVYLVGDERTVATYQIKKTEHGYKKVIDSDFTARQQAPEIYDMNASIYVYKPDFLHSGQGVLDGYCEAVEMYDTGILDLDHESDYELLEVIAKYLFTKNEGFSEVYNNIK